MPYSRLSSAKPRLPLPTLRFLFFLLFFVATAHAHIGSPDTFLQTTIGPYNVLLAAHPPATYPGALELDVRFNPDDRITSITASLYDASPSPIPLVLDGTGTISLWAATPEAHVLHLAVQGSRGPATYSVTLPASFRSSMSSAIPRRPLLTPRFLLPLLLLVLSTVLLRRRLRIAAVGITLSLLVFTLVHNLRSATPVTTVNATLNNNHLDFILTNPSETFADLTPDHGKLMHLFLIRGPNKDVFLHLHPRQLSPGHFDASLPAMPPGTYTLFADFYHSDGRGETAALRLTLPQQSHSNTTDPDDTSAVLQPLNPVISTGGALFRRSGETPVFGVTTTLHTFTLHDNYTLHLQTPTHLTPLHANFLTATLLDPAGNPPQDMALYLGMTAHVVVLRSDDQVFAHIHPGGTLPMLMPARPDGSMPGMVMPTPSNTATIPYGFPSAGLYRVYVQMKHSNIVETAAFDLTVE